MAGTTQKIADFVTRVTFNDLPDPVVHQVKRIVLDDIGCALGANAVDRARIALEMVELQGGNPQASIIGHGKTSATLAAFANGELINSLDYDCLRPLVGHVTPYVTPPSLVIGEMTRASGKDLILALAIAHELGGRMGASISQHMLPKNEPPYYEYAPSYSYTPTIFGSTAGACKLLGLDSKGVANAFGIAGASTPVPATNKWEFTSGPSFMTKYNCWSGWIAQLATWAALMAEKGFTGDTTIMDGERGFWKIYGSPFFKEEILTGNLGKEWHFDQIWFKYYPCCGCNHTGIEAISQLMEKNKIDPEEIEQIVAKGEPHLLLPARDATEVNSFQDTQFANAYLFALAAYYGNRPSPAWQLPTTYKDPRITGLMKKVKVELHPRVEEFIAGRVKPGATAARHTLVEITARGEKFTSEVSEAKGSPSNPMSDEELAEKFRANACYSLIKTDKVNQAIEAIFNLEKVKDISELAKLWTLA